MKKNNDRIIPLGARADKSKRPSIRPITTERWDEHLSPRRSVASGLAGAGQDNARLGKNDLSQDSRSSRPTGYQSGWKWREE
jgi:hypothetical protein